MKRHTISVSAALGVLAAVAALTAPLAHAGSVTVNGNPTCTDTPTINMTPAGDLSLTCTAVSNGGGGGPTTAPVCSVLPAGTTNIQSGTVQQVIASCSPAATSWSWTVGGTGTLPAAPGNTSSGSINFANTGTFTVQVTGTNTIGTGNASTASTFVVSAAPPPPPPGTCATTTFDRDLSIGWFTFNAPSNGSAAFRLPIATHAGKQMDLTSVQSTQTPQTLTVEMVISRCPHDFSSSVAPGCYAYGNVFTGGTYVEALSGTAEAPGCTLATGVQYYLNMRNSVSPGSTTSSCPFDSCNQAVQYNGNFQY